MLVDFREPSPLLYNVSLAEVLTLTAACVEAVAVVPAQLAATGAEVMAMPLEAPKTATELVVMVVATSAPEPRVSAAAAEVVAAGTEVVTPTVAAAARGVAVRAAVSASRDICQLGSRGVLNGGGIVQGTSGNGDLHHPTINIKQPLQSYSRASVPDDREQGPPYSRSQIPWGSVTFYVLHLVLRSRRVDCAM